MQYLRHLIFVIALMPFNPASAAADLNAKLTLDEARHLLSRTGFGASAYELNKIIGQSKSAAIDTIVNGLTTVPSTAVPDWLNQPSPVHWTRNQLSKTARREFNEARYREIESLRLWWVGEMIQTQSPQTERLVLAWHNHFATGYTHINDQAISIARQHMMFRELGSGNFRTLLKAIIRDPAMLNYLDNDNSRKQAPNENLARELMELFSLGEGNYTESDIKQAARALTGYSSAPNRNQLFQFKANNHDKSQKTILGKSGNFDGDDLIDQILTQPAAAEFIARKFWRMLISDQLPHHQQIEPLANNFRESDYDIKTLYRATLESDAFWSADNRATIVRSPVSLTIGTIRSTAIVPGTWQVLPNIMDQLGQQLFDPPNVAGWPGGRAWVTPSRLLNRLEWLRSLDQNFEGANYPTSMASMSDSGATSMQMTNNMTGGMAGRMTGGMAGDSDAEMAASTADMSASSDLIIRMASEEIDGPVLYQVTLTRGDMILWSSGRTPLPAGYDTKRYGRIKNSNALPWRSVRFSLPDQAKKFDTIEIEYLNDKNQRGAQQNLFIDWASYDQKLYNADDGKQNNQCPNRKKARGGNLLCNGKVRLSKPVVSSSQNTSDNKEILSVGGVYLGGIVDPDRGQGRNKPANISFTLTDVQLGDRKWNTLTAQYSYNAKNKQYSLKMNSFGCWPDCLQQWPACNAKAADKSGIRQLAIYLTPKSQNNCPYNALTEADKKLINSLWSNLPHFYQHISNNPKLNRDALRIAYTAWSPHINKISQRFQHQIQAVISATVAPATLQLNDQSQLPNIAKHFIQVTPLPAGRTAAQQQQDMQTLVTKNPDTNLATLLLPGSTSSRYSSEPGLQDVLMDLAFQLK